MLATPARNPAACAAKGKTAALIKESGTWSSTPFRHPTEGEANATPPATARSLRETCPDEVLFMVQHAGPLPSVCL